MVWDIGSFGSRPITGLLARSTGIAAAYWHWLPRQEIAAMRMAVGVLFRQHGGRLDIHGRVYLTSRRLAPNVVWLWRAPA
jgi:hypothetical protein